MANIVQHQFHGATVSLRDSDGYINATAMAKAHLNRTGQRKDIADWLRNKRTKETLKHLSLTTDIPVTALTQVFQGGNPETQGTWIHPKLAVRLGMWLSDDFGLAIENWVEEWKSGQIIKPKTALELAKEQVKLLEQLELQEQMIKNLEAENQLQAEAIDELYSYSSIIRIAKFNNCSEKAFSWQKLKAASETLGIEIKRVPCPRFEYKNLYSHDVWRFVYPEYKLPETTTLVINTP